MCTVYPDSGRSFARLLAMAISEDRLRQLPGTLRPAVSRWFDRLGETYGSITLAPEVEEQLLRVVAASEFAAAVLLVLALRRRAMRPARS